MVQASKARQPNILLLDDEELTQELIKHMLTEIKCQEIIIFSSGAKALNHLKKNQQHFDLVISDWEMPGMDGLEFLKLLRKFDKQTPLLMVTGNTRRDLVLEAIKAGVNDFLGKPFTARDLLTKVRKLLRPRARREIKQAD